MMNMSSRLFAKLAIVAVLSFTQGALVFAAEESTPTAEAKAEEKPAAVSPEKQPEKPTEKPSEKKEAKSEVKTTAVADSAGSAHSDKPVAASKKQKNPFQKSRLTRDQSEGEADQRSLTLGAGEDKAIDLDFAPSKDTAAIAIGNPTVVAAALVTIGDKQQIVLKPLKAGDTTVSLRDDEGEIRLIINLKVTGTNLSRAAAEIKDLLRDIEGVSVRIVGQRVVLEGEILVPGDFAKVFAVIQDKAYTDIVINMLAISNIALQFIAKKIQSDIASFARDVKVRVVNGFVFLEGSVDSRDHAARAQQVAYLYIPDPRPGNPLERDPNVQKFLPPRPIIQNFIVINPPPPKRMDKLVRVTVHFVELKKEYQKLFGFKWQPGIDANKTNITFSDGTGSNGQSQGTSFTAIIQNLFPKLQFAQNAGYARILKTGNVIVRNGQKAFLTEETEFSYNLVNPNGQVTAAKEGVGLRTEVVPQILGQSEDIELDLKMNQKNLVGRGIAANGLPIVARHAVETRVYIKSQESAAVAGVNSHSAGTDFNKDDPNPSSPSDPLFTLLRSKNYHKERAQFVIFVTPQIVENASEGTEDLKRSFRVKAK